jgi:hypothetical protein
MKEIKFKVNKFFTFRIEMALKPHMSVIVLSVRPNGHYPANIFFF